MRDSLPQQYDHAWLLSEIVDGYYVRQMTTTRRDDEDQQHDDPDRFALEREQAGRARDEERFAREADHPYEEREHERRAEKAAYLRDKLGEAADADAHAAREDG
jgi:hypothetical protein